MRDTGDSPGQATVLAVDDDEGVRAAISHALSRRGKRIELRSSGPAALEWLRDHTCDAVITDLRMPEMSGVELCARIRETEPDLPVLLLTGYGDYESAVDALRAGAYDFLTKPFRLDLLDAAVSRAVDHSRLRREVRRLRVAAAEIRPSNFIGDSPAMREVYDLIARVAPSHSSVLISGESGTGKELVARAIHEQSPRSDGPFIAVNCAAIPEALLEAELFGYERGAFTDARNAKPGLFIEANGGTLFLDEIGELPLGLQAKLLRALQERTVRPLGGRRELPYNARVLAATNVNLESAIHERRFRDDLYFRINVVEISLPPLRARGNDILVLASHFLGQFGKQKERAPAGFHPQVVRTLLDYSWPGNVRELQNTIERAVVLAQHEELVIADLPQRIVSAKRTVQNTQTEMLTLEEVERRHVLCVLESSGGSKSAAAKILGLDRSTLWRKLERFRLDHSNQED